MERREPAIARIAPLTTSTGSGSDAVTDLYDWQTGRLTGDGTSMVPIPLVPSSRSMDRKLVGAAGEHLVCSVLAQFNWAAALTREGVARTDVLAVNAASGRTSACR